MIVGVLLFTPLLLLLPTTTVYYVLALVLHTTVYFTCEAMHLAAELLYLNPACFLWCWVFQPSMVSGDTLKTPYDIASILLEFAAY